MSEKRGDVARCRLLRSDGSEWTVTDFDIDEGAVRVDARREDASVDGGSPGNGGLSGEAALVDEPLRNGDRVEWLKSDGTVIWAMRNPVDGDVRWNVQSGSRDSEFLAEDFRESA